MGAVAHTLHASIHRALSYMTRVFLPCTEVLTYSLPHELELQAAARSQASESLREQNKTRSATMALDEKNDGVVRETQPAQTEPEPVVNEKPRDVSNNQSTAPQKQESQAPGSSNDSNNSTDSSSMLAKAKPKGPSGGFDRTVIPQRPAGYTIKITVHRATNLPMADIHGFSSDPYCLTQMNTDTPTRHKEDPHLRWRTSTVRKSTEPEWNEEWIIANVPASGFKLKIRIMDEDPADKDDLLGKVHIDVPSLDESWAGIQDQGYQLRAYDGSIRAYMLQAVSTCFRENKNFRGHLNVSIEMLGRTKEDGQNGRVYTVGPCRWIRHFSPMLGRLANIKEPDEEEKAQGNAQASSGEQKKKVERYNFQANQIQLQGPVPAELYHRFVEFKPWVGRMFTSKGLSGVLMGKALRHQHTRVYNFGRSTEWGHPKAESEDMTRQFLDLVHWDHGGRIFTYVLTLDALWRFTETGKEFGIDMLSKHTMHSDVSVYIAYSGEFFIRRLKHAKRPPPPEPAESASQAHPPPHEENEEHPPKDLKNGPPVQEDGPKDPSYYELVIDNDSGTYRPEATMLPVLKKFLQKQLPGLHILTLDCNKDAEKQQRMKKEQRERKKREGDHIIYTQGSRASSISSSDEDELDQIQASLADEQAIAREHGPMSQAAKDAKLRNKSRLIKAKRSYLPHQLGPEAADAPSVQQ